MAAAAAAACSACEKYPATSRCGRCKRVVYCNGACQRNAWQEHRAFCGKPAAELKSKWDVASQDYVSSRGERSQGVEQFVRQVGPTYCADDNGWEFLHNLTMLGMTLQHGGTAAADQKLVEICSLALEHKADIDAQTKFGGTPLHLACVSNVTPMIGFLLEQTPVRLDLLDQDGKTAEEVCQAEGRAVFNRLRHLPDDYRLYLAARKGDHVNELVHGIHKIDGSLGVSFLSTLDLAPGTLILRETALAVAQNSSSLVAKITGATDEVQSKLHELFPRDSLELTPSNLLKICHRNAFSLASYETYVNDGVDDAPAALFHKASFFNHSCRPNCVWSVVGNVIFVRTIATIKRGEECFVSYTSLVQPWPIRKQRLLRLGFECKCNRCLEECGCVLGRNLSQACGEHLIAKARSLRNSGEVASATSILEKLHAECTDSPTSCGIRCTTADILQLLFVSYLDLKRFEDAYHVGTEMVAFHRPFRLQAIEYLTGLVKTHPMKLLGAAGMEKIEEYMNELREVSSFWHGGGLNILFEQYRQDFGVRGF